MVEVEGVVEAVEDVGKGVGRLIASASVYFLMAKGQTAKL